MINQLNASGKSLFKATLKQRLKTRITEIQLSESISKEEKISKISALKKSIHKKLTQSEFYNF